TALADIGNVTMYRIKSGKFFAALAALLITTFTYAQPKEVDRVVAIVDDDVVLKSEYDERWAQIEPQVGPITAPQRAQLRRQVLDQIILEHLQLQMAERAGVRVDDNRLNQQLERIAQGNNMTFEQFRQVLAAQGLYEPTRQAIPNEMLIGELQGG